MSYEFMKLSDVEVVETPAKTANVLIEENGIIKKAPKTAVGGAGGNEEEWDVIIEGGEFANMLITSATWDNATIPSGSYEKLMEIINSGKHPKILFKYTYVYGSTPYPGSIAVSGIMNFSSGIHVSGFYSWDGEACIFTTTILPSDYLYSTKVS